LLDPRVGNATRVLLLRRWLSSIVRTRLGEPNVWSGRALQEGSFELAELRPGRALSDTRGGVHLQTGCPFTTAMLLPGGHPFCCG
jgi:hypothetical protein